MQEPFYHELITAIKKRKLTKQKLSNYKMQLCKKHGRKEMPTDIEILLNADEKDIKKIKYLLQTKPVRSGSGVAVIAVMTKPFGCPHGKCTMCPGGPNSHFGDVPQSYTGNEPATMRGIRNNYDAYLQVMNRLEQYVVLGQDAEKVELIIMGGTFPAMPSTYQKEFVTYCYKAMNDFSKLFYTKGHLDILAFKRFFMMPGPVASPERIEKIHAELLKRKGKGNLLREQKKNEKADVRCVGMTIETRPDWGRKKQGNRMLDFGITRIELGVQSVYGHALARLNRGHTTAESIASIRELKDLGFKLNLHVMPGIPGIARKRDVKGLQLLFEDEDYRPDMLKVYPLMVMPGTPLYDDWKKGKFIPLTTAGAAEIISEMKKDIPPYVRIMRVQRDIPTKFSAAGVDKNNLRQYITAIMHKKGYTCHCIRCREPKGKLIGKPKLKIHHYIASQGNEFFITIETKNALLGFLRLRFPSQCLRKEITPETALIRELHVYSSQVGIGQKPKKGQSQHKGYGKCLLKAAEEIAKTYYKDKLVVISGIGVRDYYRKLGYRKEGPYMVKKII
ncbi:MAG: tRNA uridine(34) 5-carboxymethylaminomethyl modification radical SAM/GNAT enzyme Elp3 [Nanoarchaeota archaeon]